MPKLRFSQGKVKKTKSIAVEPDENPGFEGEAKKPRFYLREWPKSRRFLKYSFITGTIITLFFVVWVGKDLPNPDKLNERVFEESTKIYDRSGEHLLYEIYLDKKRTIVELDKIPKYLIEGVIATEDTKFYEHHGIRPLSIARSFAYGLMGKGRIGGGASTLTQQLVKNAVLIDEGRGPIRKAKEIILALWLEQKYNKDEILKIYFNEIPYGGTNYGVESASQSYFNKHVQDLTLAEAATLAGLPQLPSYYLSDLDALKRRRNFVLQRMVDVGYLNLEEANKAKEEPLEIKKTVTRMDAPHFVKYVQQQLVDEYGENTVGRGGLKVITTLDWKKQEIAEKAIQNKAEALLKQGDANNAGLLALDPKTAQVLAMVGSKNYYDDTINGQFNVTTQARRQPGSSMKPIIFTAAFAKGYTPSTVLYDVTTQFGGIDGVPSYIPKNYDLGEHGLVTMRQALQGSLNIPSVKTLYLVGLDQAKTFAEKLGYTTFGKEGLGLSLVLGGGEVKMLEHVNAYGIFANNGKKQTVTSILKVEDTRGKVLYEWKSEDGEQVLDAGVAATISNVLSDDGARAYIFGAGSALTLPGRPVAAKTGTTNNYVDGWIVGYTPSLVAGVWVGNSNNKPMKYGYGGSKMAGEVWNYFMRESLKGTPVEKFPTPPINKNKKPILNGGSGGVTAMIDKYTNRLATSSTPESFIVTRSYLIPHDILHYVDKNDPQGAVPSDPGKDPMYKNWEQGLQSWITRRKEKDPNLEIVFSEPPTEYDDVFTLESIPTIDIISPQPGALLISRNLEFSASAQSTRGVKKVSYYIDGNFIGSSAETPFVVSYEAKTLSQGDHTLMAVAEDDNGARGERTIPFSLDAAAKQPGVYFENLPNLIQRTDFPFTVYLRPYEVDKIKRVVVSAQSSGKNIVLYETNNASNLFDNSLVFVWKDSLESDKVTIKAQVEFVNGENKVTDTRVVEIKN